MRIFKTLVDWFASHKSASPLINSQEQEGVLKLKSEIAGLHLSIASLQESLANQKALYEDAEKNKTAFIEQTLDARLHSLFANLAPPMAQLGLLQNLFSQGKEIKTENVFKLVSLLANTLEDAGMTPLHQPNETCLYNPATMTPAKTGLSFTQNEKVLVRLQGYSFNGKLISKSLVDKIL
jgi:molecular chaperone GrpE (heat shock protein)